MIPTTDMPVLQDRNRPDSSSEDNNEYNTIEVKMKITPPPKTMVNTINSHMTSLVQIIQEQVNVSTMTPTIMIMIEIVMKMRLLESVPS